MNEEKEIQIYDFLDAKCVDMELYKVLKPHKDNSGIFFSTGWKSGFRYALDEWFFEKDAILDRSTNGKGFYSYIGLEVIIAENSSYIHEFLNGDKTIHPVRVREVCAISKNAVRTRKVIIEDPLTIDEIIKELTNWGETPEDVLEKFTEYTKELKRFSAIKSILDAQKNAKERQAIIELNKPLISAYWEKYEQFEPFLKRLSVTKEVFRILKLPHNLGENKHSFRGYYENSYFKDSLDNLDIGISFLVSLAKRHSQSSKSLVTRLNNHAKRIEKMTLKEIDHVKGVLETYTDLLADVPIFDDIRIEDEYTRGDLKKAGRKRYDFWVSRVSVGSEKKEEIDERGD